jgi:hypothetical protein
VRKRKAPWRDGTTHLVMSPLEFMQRLDALYDRTHQWLLHGCQFRESDARFGSLCKAFHRGSIAALREGRLTGATIRETGSPEGRYSPPAPSAALLSLKATVLMASEGLKHPQRHHCRTPAERKQQPDQPTDLVAARHQWARRSASPGTIVKPLAPARSASRSPAAPRRPPPRRRAPAPPGWPAPAAVPPRPVCPACTPRAAARPWSRR